MPTTQPQPHLWDGTPMAAMPYVISNGNDRPAHREHSGNPTMVSALYVEPKGCYIGVPGVDPWYEARDARTYAGPHPVVAHPPCQRWGRFWHGSTRKPHQFFMGDDKGCFLHAIASVRRWGGVLEHPADTHAWERFGILKPPRNGGWVPARTFPAPGTEDWTCCVYQGHYGHQSGKATWLYVSGVKREDLPMLTWGKTEQRLPEWMIERYGYEKARRIGVVAMIAAANPAATLALLDELQTLRSERTAWRVSAENAEKELSSLKSSLGEPVAEIIMSDDDFDMGLTDDYAFGRKTLTNGTHQLYALSNKETP